MNAKKEVYKKRDNTPTHINEMKQCFRVPNTPNEDIDKLFSADELRYSKKIKKISHPV